MQSSLASLVVMMALVSVTIQMEGSKNILKRKIGLGASSKDEASRQEKKRKIPRKVLDLRGKIGGKSVRQPGDSGTVNEVPLVNLNSSNGNSTLPGSSIHENALNSLGQSSPELRQGRGCHTSSAKDAPLVISKFRVNISHQNSSFNQSDSQELPQHQQNHNHTQNYSRSYFFGSDPELFANVPLQQMMMMPLRDLAKVQESGQYTQSIQEAFQTSPEQRLRTSAGERSRNSAAENLPSSGATQALNDLIDNAMALNNLQEHLERTPPTRQGRDYSMNEFTQQSSQKLSAHPHVGFMEKIHTAPKQLFEVYRKKHLKPKAITKPVISDVFLRTSLFGFASPISNVLNCSLHEAYQLLGSQVCPFQSEAIISLLRIFKHIKEMESLSQKDTDLVIQFLDHSVYNYAGLFSSSFFGKKLWEQDLGVCAAMCKVIVARLVSDYGRRSQDRTGITFNYWLELDSVAIFGCEELANF